ncbi:MAG TPA: hypothetical protein VGL53_29165, partial [Bryobacteraceae bacterium]
MTTRELKKIFPGLQAGFKITSPSDDLYNCIAWSVNDKDRWWWPTPPGKWVGKYWPASAPEEATLAAFTKAYQDLGFEICVEDSFENG